VAEQVSGLRDVAAPRTASAEEFRRAARCFASGVTIVSAADGDVVHAITATAFCSLSLDPPMVLVAVAESSRLLPLVRATGHYAVSVLGEGHRELAIRTARPGRPLGNVVETVAATRGLLDLLLVEGAIATFECRLERQVHQGDHVILIGRVLRCAAHAVDDRPLLYYEGGYHTLATHPERLAG
jgi:flavin reductase (DIM6/NTAB) family NADH-FMN oxidoreductase RutF